MIEVRSLHKRNIDVVEVAYNHFRSKAMSDYQWTEEPVDFATMKKAFEAGFLKGLVIEDPAEKLPIGFMLYVYEEHRSIEINLIHIEEEKHWKSMFDFLMREFLAEIKTREHTWDCASYPMLGIQDRFVLTAPWYGFVPVGQTIQKFDLTNELCLPILAKYNETAKEVPDGYTMVMWDGDGFKNSYQQGVKQAIADAFAKSNDAQWDPRFRTVEGAGKALAAMKDGRMGRFLPECTSVLIHNETDTPIGFCFLVQSDVTVANIPLIGLNPAHKGKKLGNFLLKSTLMSAVKKIVDGELLLTEINATVDTDNFFALKMYRRLGFQETTNYPHCYLNKETVSNSYYGRAVFTDQKAGCCNSPKIDAQKLDDTVISTSGASA